MSDIGGRRELSQPHASRWNWGVFGEPCPLLTRHVRPDSPPSAARRSIVEQADRFRQTYTQVGAAHRVSVQPRDARRVQRGRCGTSVSARGARRGLRPGHGELLSDEHRRPPGCREPQSRRCSSTRAGARHGGLRRDESDLGQPLPARGLADVRRPADDQRHRRLPAVRHAGPAGDVRRPRHARRPIRQRAARTRGCRRCSSATRRSCAGTTSIRSSRANARSRSTAAVRSSIG